MAFLSLKHGCDTLIYAAGEISGRELIGPPGGKGLVVERLVLCRRRRGRRHEVKFRFPLI